MRGTVQMLVLAAAGWLGACSDSGTEPQQPSASAAPTAPASNDPAYTVEQSRRWMLVGNDLTPANDVLTITIQAPAGVEQVVPWVADTAAPPAARDGDTFTVTLDVTKLEAAAHRVLLAADGDAVAFAVVDFIRSHPLYVIMTVDWDRADPNDAELAWHETLHTLYPELKITQLVGPYTYTESSLPMGRATELSSWLQNQRSSHGDELGLHIHPYCSFVDAAGVTCRLQPSVVDDMPDASGYTVNLAAYTKPELLLLFQHADTIFQDNGLGKPTSFRAGAWMANADVLEALAETGYVVDTSANNWARLEEWTDPTVAPIYTLNEQFWSTIGDTSQPYFPSKADVQVAGDPSLAILEVPDNGSLVDYVTEIEMIDIFNANWSGAALSEPGAYSIGFHNSTYGFQRQRIELTLTHVMQYAASADAGPVVFINLSDAARVWRQ
jgi:hypothetical protein